MSNDLRDLFKKELDQIPLRPAETWVPERRRTGLLPRLAWRAPLAVIGAIVILIVAIIGGRQLAVFRNQSAATPGVVAGKAIYLSPSFNGSGWIQIDPENLKDVSPKPLLGIASSSTNSSETQVSADGSTIIVSDFSGSAVTRRVFDGRTGQLRGYFVPEVAMVLDYLSADAMLGLGRVGDNRSSLTGENVLVTIPEGHVLRHLFAMDVPGAIQRVLVSPDLSTRYYVTTPSAVDPSSTAGLQPLMPYSLYVRSTTDQLSGPIALPGITGGTEATGATPRTVRPAIAISDDGRRLAALSIDGGTLDLVDVKTLAVTTLNVHKKTSFLDPFRPLVAQAKTLNDEEQQALVFTPDGGAVISWVTETHYDDVNGPTRTTRGIQRVDLATGLVTAENASSDGIYGFVMSPDGQNVYLVVRTQEPPNPLYVLRRLDTTSLEVKAERTLPDYAELQLLAAPAPAAAIATATPPTTWQERLVADAQKVQEHLAYWPLVPTYAPVDVAVQVATRDGCGLSTSPCLDYHFESSTGTLVLEVLQGPAGCCLDAARPGAERNIDIRPGVRAQYDPVDPQFGGPILWWVEDTARGPVYVALNSPVFSEDELIRIASSMRPLPASPPTESPQPTPSSTRP